MICQWVWSNFGHLYLEVQGCVPVLLENFRGMSYSGICWPLLVLGFSIGMEAFDELLLINVPWSQEFSGCSQDLDLSLLLLVFSLIFSLKSSPSVQHH